MRSPKAPGAVANLSHRLEASAAIVAECERRG
jgi:hypothetical protein